MLLLLRVLFREPQEVGLGTEDTLHFFCIHPGVIVDVKIMFQNNAK
jgi:hypothetical protein